MAKFLKIDTGANGKFLIPSDGFIFAKRNTNTDTLIFYTSDNNLESIAIFHDSTTGSEVADFIQDEMVRLAETNWRNAVVDITGKSPFTITDLAIQ
jgi:hypothetical protein